jgi:hypothetical protein
MPSIHHHRAVAALARGLAAATLAALCGATSAQPVGQPGGIDPAAQRLLKASTDFLAAQQAFTLDTRNSLEVVMYSGQKIEFNHTTKGSVQRPNKFRVERAGDLAEQVFVYDGQALTLFNPADKAFATVAAPPTLEGMLDFARDSLDIVAPAGDALYKNAYEILTQDVMEAFVVGKGVIEGVRCDHIAMRAPHVDTQIWIQEGAQPLLRKIVLTTRDVFNAPQFSVTVTKWDLKPTFGASTFAFTPPSGATKVEFAKR